MADAINRGIYKKSFTPLEQRFVDAYFTNGFNATDAARKAGCQCKTPAGFGQAAQRIINRPRVKAEIERRRTMLTKKSIATVQRIEEEFANIAFFDPRRLFDANSRMLPVDQLPEDLARAIAGIDITTNKDGDVTRKIRIADKKGALDSLARIRGMFVDTVHIKTDFADRLVKARERAGKTT